MKSVSAEAPYETELSIVEYPPISSTTWTHLAAAGALTVGAVLLLTGRRKAGALTAATGAAFALLEDGNLIERAWQELPQTLSRAQEVCEKAAAIVESINERAEKLQRALGR